MTKMNTYQFLAHQSQAKWIQSRKSISESQLKKIRHANLEKNDNVNQKDDEKSSKMEKD